MITSGVGLARPRPGGSRRWRVSAARGPVGRVERSMSQFCRFRAPPAVGCSMVRQATAVPFASAPDHCPPFDGPQRCHLLARLLVGPSLEADRVVRPHVRDGSPIFAASGRPGDVFEKIIHSSVRPFRRAVMPLGIAPTRSRDPNCSTRPYARRELRGLVSVGTNDGRPLRVRWTGQFGRPAPRRAAPRVADSTSPRLAVAIPSGRPGSRQRVGHRRSRGRPPAQLLAVRLVSAMRRSSAATRRGRPRAP